MTQSLGKSNQGDDGSCGAYSAGSSNPSHHVVTLLAGSRAAYEDFKEWAHSHLDKMYKTLSFSVIAARMKARASTLSTYLSAS